MLAWTDLGMGSDVSMAREWPSHEDDEGRLCSDDEGGGGSIRDAMRSIVASDTYMYT